MIRIFGGLFVTLLCGSIAASARANEADDAITRLAGQARAQASAHATEEVKRTLSDISANIPKATLQGVATANALLSDLSKIVPKEAAGTPDQPGPQPAAGGGKPEPGPGDAQPSAPQPATAVAPTKPAMPASMRELMQKQGDEALRNGNISGARRFYQKGAEGGCAPCADALANTYSAEWLAQSGAVDIKPDQTQSDLWRALARQLTQATNP